MPQAKPTHTAPDLTPHNQPPTMQLHPRKAKPRAKVVGVPFNPADFRRVTRAMTLTHASAIGSFIRQMCLTAIDRIDGMTPPASAQTPMRLAAASRNTRPPD